MLERKLINRLDQWKENVNKKALIIEGARQVGKTYIVNHFAKTRYNIQTYIYINLETEVSKRDIFEGDISGEMLYNKISLVFRDKIHKNKRTLLFIDEIQAFPRAITALKSLTIDGRLDVIASGSLLGVNYSHVSSFPVGYVDRMTLSPLDFEEFLWSQGILEEQINTLEKFYKDKKQVPKILHETYLELFKHYMTIGGMPEVINVYNKTKDFNEVLKSQKGIIDDYKSDIAKYAISRDKANARECFDSIPAQLGKDNKKFQYKVVAHGGRSSKYEGSIQWLIDSGIAMKCNNLSKPEEPLISHKRIDAFKLYLSDPGLLVSMIGESAQTKLLFGDLGIHKGAIYENVVATVLKNRGYDLFYYEKNSKIEIDFIIIKEGLVTGIEVKSADNRQAKSIKSFIDYHEGDFAILLSSKNLFQKDKELRVPLYMSIFL